MAPRVLVVAQLPTEWLEPLQAAGLDISLAPELADCHARCVRGGQMLTPSSAC